MLLSEGGAFSPRPCSPPVMLTVPHVFLQGDTDSTRSLAVTRPTNGAHIGFGIGCASLGKLRFLFYHLEFVIQHEKSSHLVMVIRS